jgi:SAM-dependent methyltransferase
MGVREDFYASVGTYAEPHPRHRVFVDAYERHRRPLARPMDVLDVGCGEHAVLAGAIQDPDRYHGVDIKASIAAGIERYASVDLESGELASAFPEARFDVVFCGEVLEHMFSPDRLLRQLASVLRPDGLLVLSTPNLAYWVNRLLLLLGISPLFIENSSEVTLGRRSRRLGQGQPTQGHVRVFTHRAVLDLLAREGYTVVKVIPTSVWNLPGDGLMNRVSPHLAADNVYLLRFAR